jgi:probable phosphoglycerate mutase
METTTILFIRHGQTDWNAERRWQGHLDIPLNEIGQQQATAVAHRLAHWPIQAIISSDLRRSAETAQIIAQRHNLQPLYDTAWRERNVGDFSGLTTSDIAEKYPEEWAKRHNAIWEMPNAETHDALRERARCAFEQVRTTYNGQTVAVVTHGAILHALMAQIMGINQEWYGRFSIGGNTGLSIVEDRDGRIVVTRLNDTAHLENMDRDA